MKEQLIIDYQNLHQIPEEGFREFKTQKYILEQLKSLNCEINELEPTGILAFFNYDTTESIAFRCELDGIMVDEENDLEYKSKHKGLMHACGHDGHMAILLGLARTLSNIKCPRNVCLIFQPSEERYGGAIKVIDSEIYKKMNVKEVYALHLWPNLKSKVVASRGRILMASSTEIDIEIIGKSAHIANKEEGIDAINIASILLERLKNEDGVLFNCGKITSIGARNVICKYVKLECSLRSFYKIRRKSFLTILNNFSKELSREKKAKIIINSNRYIPEVSNNLILFEKHRHLIDEVVAPVLMAEDFSFYGIDSKTLFLFLGIGDSAPLHSGLFKIDEGVLEKGVKTFVAIATSR